MASRDIVLSAEHLTKKIKKRIIVDDISFEVHAGELFGFLGPNGAGKTTTIRMLVGLIKPTSGTVRICGYDVRHEFERATRCIGAIVESPDLYRFLSGRENLEHFSRMLGITDGDEIERVATMVNLESRLDDKVRTYSLGMRQRLGIAQSLLGEPRLLILDEPANGLDPAGIREMRELLRRLSRDQGISVFVSSHLLAEVELLCDRVAIIHRGRLLRTATVAELVAQGRELEVKTSDLARSGDIIESLGIAVRLNSDHLIAATDETAAPRIIEQLVANGVEVYRVAPRVQTLEETFLEATGGETV